MIAAIGRNRELGKGNDLLWKIPDDLKRFKELTKGHPVIMGRKTYESLPVQPLPGRTNIVITRDATWASEGALTAESINEAIGMAAFAEGAEETYIIGGGQIYTAALSYADMLQLTLIDAEAEADSFFPAYEHLFTKKVFEEQCEWNGLTYTWVDLVR
ncbi:MAG: hypothetical protein RLZZ342_143 [Candidatus Parcubacteria bacterium]|jgi:dihydrofolate reductase